MTMAGEITPIQYSSRRNTFDHLPSDLIIYLTDFLPSSSKACLGLTCRALYHLIWAKCEIDLTSRAERLYFLNCISRDTPEYIPCHGWLNPKLYRWSQQRNNFYHCDHCFTNPNHRTKYSECANNCPSWSCGFPVLGLCAQQIHLDHNCTGNGWITFGLRQLVLRHELLGPTYGVPLSTLEHTCYPSVLDKASTRLTVRNVPKIVRGGNLMIHKTVTFRTKLDEWIQKSPVCCHVFDETWAVAGWIYHFFGLKQRARNESRKRLSQSKSKSQPKSSDSNSDSQDPSSPPEIDPTLLKIATYPDNHWHRCSILLKCDYCATDTRLYVRQLLQTNNNNTTPITHRAREYLLRFESYHDFGSLYRPLTTPQRQLIEVATHLPAMQARYPSLAEYCGRFYEDLEERYNEVEDVPINGRGVAMREVEEGNMAAKRRESWGRMNGEGPSDAYFFSQWGEKDGVMTGGRPSGFRKLMGEYREARALEGKEDEVFPETGDRTFLPFEPFVGRG